MKPEVTTAEIIERAKGCVASVPKTHAINIEPVFDSYTCTKIITWRKDNGYAPSPLHGMMSRVGSFPPHLARYFIAAYTDPGDTVLDPFCGKGTTLVEAILIGRLAVGGDIAPDAVVTSRAKCAKVSTSDIATYIQGLKVPKSVSLRSIPADVSLFYSKTTLKQIVALRKQILKDLSQKHESKKKNAATFICGVMLGLLHGHSQLSLSLPCNQCFAMSPNYVRKYVKEHGLVTPNRDVKECLLLRSLDLLCDRKDVARARIYKASAHTCGSYMKRVGMRAKLVLTSPPYLNKQTYIRDAWLRLWFLGEDRSALLSHSFETGNVRRFVDHMTVSLDSIWDAMVPNGILVLVCGRAKIDVRGKSMLVHVRDLCLLATKEVAQKGKRFFIEQIINDKILMKRGSYFAVHHGKTHDGNGNQSKRYGEDEILILRRLK